MGNTSVKAHKQHNHHNHHDHDHVGSCTMKNHRGRRRRAFKPRFSKRRQGKYTKKYTKKYNGGLGSKLNPNYL